MTINTTATYVIAQGNGVTSTFNYAFLIPAVGDVNVFYTDVSGGISLLAPAQYTITGVGDSTGGTVIFPLSGSPIPIGASLTIVRDVPLFQLTTINNQGAFYPHVVESSLDYLMMAIQDVNTRIEIPTLPSPLTPIFAVQNILTLEGLAETGSGLVIYVEGYYAAGDGGGAYYKRVLAAPSHPGKVQSGDGTWWEIYETVISPRMLGATGNGTTDDQATFQNAINTAIALRSVLFIPGGTFKILTPLTVNGSLTISGAGRRTAIIQLGSTTQNGINIAMAGGVFQDAYARIHFSNFGVIGRNNTPTAGDLINIQTTDVTPLAAFVARDLWLEDGWNGFHSVSAAVWTVDNCQFYGQFNDAIVIEDTANTDHGDSIIISNHMLGRSLAGSAAIRHLSGGGLRVIGNIAEVFDYGYYLVEDAAVNTSELFISTNRFNLMDVAAIKLAKGAGAGFNTVTIVGNKLMSAGKAIDLSETTVGWLAYVAITGNIIWTVAGGTPTAVDIAAATNFVLADNVIIAGGGITPTAVNIGANATGLVANNVISAGFTNGIVNASANVALLARSGASFGINEASPDYKLDVNGSFGFAPGASVTPVDNGDVVFQLTSNTVLTVKAKGSDGTIRSAAITLS